MFTGSLYLALLPLAALIDAKPIDARQPLERRDWSPYTPCTSCLRSTWTQGPECTTDAVLTSVESRLTNPPPEATATYTPTEFCSEYLRQTDWTSVTTTSSGVSTYTNWTETHILVTKTDFDHPTSTMYCAIPSPSMECGWSNPNIIAPEDQGEDWSIEHYYDPTACQQICLQHDACKSYRVVGTNGQWDCEIFDKGLGVNASNVISASKPGPNETPQWWDRDCQTHLPAPCSNTDLPTGTLPAAAPAATTIPATSASQPTITPTPTVLGRNAPLEKRTAPLPAYLSSEYANWYSSLFVLPACSCLITSALPPTKQTSTLTRTTWTSTATVYTTYSDIFTVTETPRSTTLYVSIS